jgi:hypothetical protein
VENDVKDMVALLRSMSCCYQEALTRFYLYDQSEERVCKEMHLSVERFWELKATAKHSFCQLDDTHDLDGAVERFSMGKLRGAELAEFETHLLQCDQCQVAVSRTDLFLVAIRSAGEYIARQGKDLSASVFHIAASRGGQRIAAD